ncbi:IS4 family transposase [Streptomyces sp. CA-106131]|uniref:IS4 family transposase n=1 Tax=Streptomyces sp. CA-106131 TaxID=3240045 RepID=UPI003D8FF2B9
MPGQCATITLTRSSTVAAGVYAPGHLGELTQVIPFELVDAVLEETGRTQQRLRALPSRVGVYYMLALALFPDHGYQGVWRQLTAALGDLPLPQVSTTALRHLRRRLTPAPLKLLFETLAGPLAQPTTPGVRYRHLRTVAFDGCSSIKTPDSERARGWLGKIRYRLAWAGYPTVMLMALVETGTRGLLGACLGPSSAGETSYAKRLLPLLGRDHLLLIDRGFDSNTFLAEAAATGAQFLARCKSTRRPPLLRALSDGSYLSRFGELTVRVIEADIVCVLADGTHVGGRYRLATTLLDPVADPAERLTRIYAERWEIESAFFALRSTLMAGRVLRSGDRFGIEQELWAALALYQALRTVMVDAVESRPGIDPDRAGFITALQAARTQVILAAGIAPEHPQPVGTIGAAVLDNLLPARRLRISARKVKSPISRYHAFKGQARPQADTPVTAIEITIHDRTSTPLAPPSTVPPSTEENNGHEIMESSPTDGTSEEHDSADPGGRMTLALAVLASRPGEPWHARDVARILGVTNINSFRVQMSQWAHRGVIHKTGPATYTLAC